jgi:signal transduction histidine kinase/Flp pilus assembly protein TadD/CheY-like chemotaxis protein
MRDVATFLCLCLSFIGGLQPLAAQSRDQPAVAAEAYGAAIENAKTVMMADPQEALAQSDRALILAEQQSGQDTATNRATAMWLKAEALIGLNRLDEAGAIATEALAIVEKAAPGTKLNGDLLRSRGAVQALLGNVQQALADYQRAHRIYRKARIPRSQAIALNDLGQIYWEAGDYRRSLDYYKQAVEIYNDDPGFALGNHNNLGETYKALEQYADAEREYGLAIVAAKELGSTLLETRILSNLALMQIEQGKLAAAQTITNRAIVLSRNGEAADWRRFVYGVEARLAYARGDRQRAARLIDQTFAGSDLNTTELSYREFHELGAKVFDEIGETPKALAHLRAFQRLDSQARDLVATSSSQLMAAEFDFANQNLRISALKQGQLERDIKIERQRSQFRTLAFVGFAVALTIVLGLTLAAFFRIRRSRNEVRAANAELAVSNADLEHALKAKTDFLAMTSHEIRTPLNGILGTAQVLLSKRDLDDENLKRINLIKSAGETMKALVDDLLDVAKMESGQVTIEVGPTSVGSILDDAGQLWRDRMAAKGLEYHEEIGAIPDCIETDGGRVRQIVFNLLSNAVKFTRSGSVTLRATCDEAKRELAIAITDTGIGIPATEQKQVFEAFHQVDNATTREFSGTGLGLSISQNLAVALGGRIELESEEGTGSTFRLILPFTEVEASNDTTCERPTSLSECRLCLVEESQMKQAILSGLIEPHVKSVTAAGQATQCMRAIETGAVDHVVLDAGSVAKSAEDLPQMRNLLSLAQSAGIPVTVLFSPAGGLPLEDVSRLAYTQLLIKPIAGDALIAALHQVYPAPEASTHAPDEATIASAA